MLRAMSKFSCLVLSALVLCIAISCNIEKKSEVAESIEVQPVKEAAGLPNIAGQNPQGDSIFLKNIKADYILVEFWASWCPPCRQFNPHLVEIYKKYNTKGFDILSISLDHDVAKWQNAIAKDGLIWQNHISDLKGWESYWAVQYNIESIPNNLLFDKSGKIIGSSLDKDALDVTLAQLLK